MMFEHDYYFPPKDGETTDTVLCMRCGTTIKTQGTTEEEFRSKYREKKMRWVNKNGIKGDGIIILCSECHPIQVEVDNFPKIYRQILKGLQDQAKWAKLPEPTNLKDMQIQNEEAI